MPGALGETVSSAPSSSASPENFRGAVSPIRARWFYSNHRQASPCVVRTPAKSPPFAPRRPARLQTVLARVDAYRPIWADEGARRQGALKVDGFARFESGALAGSGMPSADR
jgi:hypothetical protein